MSKGFMAQLNEVLAWRVKGCRKVEHVTLAVTEKTVRRRLFIKKSEPLQYKGIAITCIGSRAARLKAQAQPQQAVIE